MPRSVGLMIFKGEGYRRAKDRLLARPRRGPGQPAGLIGQAHARLTDTEAELTAAVTWARQHGHSRAAIAGRLGTTRQAAWQRFGSRQGSQHQTRATR